MEFRQLRDFVTVVRAGSFAAASRRLNMSQPGLGYQIKQLELDLGTPLLLRHSRGVALTAAGALFLAEAEQILAAVAAARGRVLELVRSDAAELHVGLSPTPQELLAPALTHLAVAGRPVRVTFHEGLSARLIHEVQDGSLDAAICILPREGTALRTVPLYREHLHLIGPPDTVGEGSVRLADLPAFRLMVGPRDHLPRRLLDEEAARQGTTLDVAQELEPGGLRRSLVLRGNVSTVASCAMFVDAIDAGRLAARRIVEPELVLEVRMICSPGLAHTMEDALVELIRATVAANPGAAELIERAEPVATA